MPTKIPFLTSNELRQRFLDYFQKHDHKIIKSSSLIPHNDPTLLFTNAGMVQFKNVFLGKDAPIYPRATSAQRCVRAGGKHNDLEKVGYTARHHTFFEMLGNFSFGDYFKREAIYFSWQFLTEVLQIPKEKLWITVYEEDKDAAHIWLKDLKVDPTRFSYCNEINNFWSMGPTGPCGPCTEIFYDHGTKIPGGPPGSTDEDGDRYVEIWNLVFMQYNRLDDGTLIKLPQPSVDTGMGLERLAAVMQGVHSNYDTDLFRKLIMAIAKLCGTQDLTLTSLRVIADHIRSSAFLIADGIHPTNEGRGYVLRRLIRRAIRHGHELGFTQPFFYLLIKPLSEEMGQAYPELIEHSATISKILLQEEEQFNLTLTQGLKLLQEAIQQLPGKIIPGDVVFKLYDTFGFPLDLTEDMAREQGLTVDLPGFEKAMAEQRTRSRQASKFNADYHIGIPLETPTEFIGDKNLLLDNTHDHGKIIALYNSDHKPVEILKTHERGAVILDRTPFYAESGGQIGDQGILGTNSHIFTVEDTQKQGACHLHIGYVKQGHLKVGDKLQAEVDATRRAATVLNHTATHLLHMVLREVLGPHVLQKGSLVAPTRLRFDFSHNAPLTPEQIKKIEKRVNEEIRLNHGAEVKITSVEEAKQSGAMALFGEKYGEKVRVVRFGNSLELCGGTHAHATGEIGLFKIISETSISSGVRRLEAVTGDGALQWIENREAELAEQLKQSENEIASLTKEIRQLKERMANSLIQELATRIQEINGVKIIITKIQDLDISFLRITIDQLKLKFEKIIIVLGVCQQGRANLIVGVSQNLTDKIKANELVKNKAELIGGKGGGRHDHAEAGGNQPNNLDTALKSIELWIKDKLS